MAKLFLHIGCPKTGTSSIQSFLFHNHQRLAEGGCYVPLFLQRDGIAPSPHAWASLLSFEETREEPLTLDFGLADPQHRRRIVADKLALMALNLEQQTAPVWVISDEILAARMIDAGDLARLKERITDRFESITIVVYLRSQVHSAIGQMNTDVLSGSSDFTLPSPADLPEDSARYLHHKSLLEMWRSAFPEATFEVRLHRKDVVADFAGLLGFGDLSGFSFPPRLNESQSILASRIIAKYNSIIPWFDGVSPPSHLRRYIPTGVCAAFAKFPKYAPSDVEQESYSSYFLESNEWIRQCFFPELQSLFPKETVKRENLNLDLEHFIFPMPLSQPGYSFGTMEYEEALIEGCVKLLVDFTLRFQELLGYESL
jgi:hypothetical protein